MFKTIYRPFIYYLLNKISHHGLQIELFEIMFQMASIHWPRFGLEICHANSLVKIPHRESPCLATVQPLPTPWTRTAVWRRVGEQLLSPEGSKCKGTRAAHHKVEG